MRDEEKYQEAVDQYMHGYCMFMAAALHHRYGFPVGMLTGFSFVEPTREHLTHAFVVLPNGKYLDIQGEQTLREVTIFREDYPEGRFNLYSPTTLEHLERLSGTRLPADEPDVKLALEIAQKYLDRELRRWN